MSLQVTGSNISCGVWQLFNFPEHLEPERELKNIYPSIYYRESVGDCTCSMCLAAKTRSGEKSSVRRSTRFLIFSNLSTHIGTKKFVEYVKEKKLGEMFEGPAQKNPNSGNIIVVYMWAIPTNEEFCKIVGVKSK